MFALGLLSRRLLRWLLLVLSVSPQGNSQPRALWSCLRKGVEPVPPVPVVSSLRCWRRSPRSRTCLYMPCTRPGAAVGMHARQGREPCRRWKPFHCFSPEGGFSEQGFLACFVSGCLTRAKAGCSLLLVFAGDLRPSVLLYQGKAAARSRCPLPEAKVAQTFQEHTAHLDCASSPFCMSQRPAAELCQGSPPRRSALQSGHGVCLQGSSWLQ